MIRNKIVGSILGGVLALGLFGGGMVAYAQTDPATPSAPSTCLLYTSPSPRD